MKTAQGSLKEFETHLILARLVAYGNYDLAEQLLARSKSVGRMLRALIRSVPHIGAVT